MLALDLTSNRSARIGNDRAGSGDLSRLPALQVHRAACTPTSNTLRTSARWAHASRRSRTVPRSPSASHTSDTAAAVSGPDRRRVEGVKRAPRRHRPILARSLPLRNRRIPELARRRSDSKNGSRSSARTPLRSELSGRGSPVVRRCRGQRCVPLVVVSCTTDTGPRRRSARGSGWRSDRPVHRGGRRRGPTVSDRWNTTVGHGGALWTDGPIRCRIPCALVEGRLSIGVHRFRSSVRQWSVMQAGGMVPARSGPGVLEAEGSSSRFIPHRCVRSSLALPVDVGLRPANASRSAGPRMAANRPRAASSAPVSGSPSNASWSPFFGRSCLRSHGPERR